MAQCRLVASQVNGRRNGSGVGDKILFPSYINAVTRFRELPGRTLIVNNEGV